MISLTPFFPESDRVHSPSDDIAHYLGRAEEESIAVVRAVDERAAASHQVMACHYSMKAVALLSAA